MCLVHEREPASASDLIEAFKLPSCVRYLEVWDAGKPERVMEALIKAAGKQTGIV